MAIISTGKGEPRPSNFAKRSRRMNPGSEPSIPLIFAIMSYDCDLPCNWGIGRSGLHVTLNGLYFIDYTVFSYFAKFAYVNSCTACACRWRMHHAGVSCNIYNSGTPHMRSSDLLKFLSAVRIDYFICRKIVDFYYHPEQSAIQTVFTRPKVQIRM
jgi:hypothetical protein